MLMSAALRGYVLTIKLSVMETTVRNYSYWLNLLVQFTDDCEIETITKWQLLEFIAHQSTRQKRGTHKQEKLSKNSVFTCWATLSAFFKWASADLKFPNPFVGIPPPGKHERKIVPFTQDEIRRLLKGAEYTAEWRGRAGGRARSRRPTWRRDVAIILTLLDSGMRVSEIVALTLADYNQDRGRLRIAHGKGDEERYVVIGARAQKALWRYLASRPKVKPGDPLFAAGDDNHLNRVNLAHLIARIGKNANVERAHPHKFRHTMAVNFLRNGGHIALLQELLGHESPKTVMTYVQLAAVDIDSAVKFSIADNWKI